MVRTKAFLATTSCAFAVVVAGAGPAFAGEVNGNGDRVPAIDQANSICVFSGQNDDPDAPTTPGLPPEAYPNGPGGESQSYGQEVRLGFVSPHEFNPGMACRGGSNFERDD